VRFFLFILICSDYLAGTDVYGTYEASPTSKNTFSIAFSGLVTSDTDILFMTDDRTQYVATKHSTILQARGSNQPLSASLSSASSLCKLLRLLFLS
jgi:hypothetical protein